MCSFWRSISNGLRRSAATAPSEATFQRWRGTSPAFAPLPTTKAALDLLHDPSADPFWKAQVVRELVVAVQLGSPDPSWAWTLLWLGLWPGLNAIHRRHQRWFSNDGDLSSTLVEHFTVAVRRLELNGGTAIAATLILNTERQLVDSRQRSRRVRTQEREAATALLDDAHREAYPSPTLQTVTASLALRGLSPDDRRLVMLLVSGFSAHELGAMLGATKAAIWKRIERLRSAIRADDSLGLSSSTKKSTKTMSGSSRGHRL